MHPAVAQLSHHVRESPQLLAPLALSLFATIANVHEPVNYSLSITSASWALVLGYCLFKVGIRPTTNRRRQNTSWLAGAFIALACICDRAACDKEGSWAVKGILPILVVLLSRNELLPKLLTLPTHIHDHDDIKHAEDAVDEYSHTRSYYLLTAATVSATVVLACYSASTTTTLSTSGVIFAATGLVLLDIAFRTPDEHQRDALRVPSAEGGTLALRQSPAELPCQSQLAVYRDFAITIVIFTSIPACLMESPSGAAASWKPVENGSLQQWRMSHDYRILQWILWTIPINAFANILILTTMSQHGATNTSLFVLSTYIFAKIRLTASFTTFWFGMVYGSASLLYMFGTSPPSPFTDTRGSLRLLRRGILGITVVSISLLMVRFAIEAQQHRIPDTAPSFVPTTPLSPFTTVPIDLSKGHPAMQLIGSAETEFQKKLDRQSKNLASTVREYRRRNGIAPPPHFDKWYEFATRHDVVMIDEFDGINEMLQPFWAIKPATIRSRITRELGGEDSALLGIAIRNGAIVNIDKGDDWQRNATVGMLEKFVQYLPDMDIGFNVYDEPRVVVPTHLLSQMVTKARDEVLPRVAKHVNPRNTFSDRPKDMNDGRRFTETYVSNFNRFAHQQTWTQARLSCPIDSQSQNYEDYAPDNVTAYATGPLGHLYNTTAFSDICISPSLSSTFGFFERPNAFSIIHELTPIFSQSKISSFQDLLYPSPWYWAGRVTYDASEDTDWTNKTNSLYWRGSTTGGFSRNSGWRRQHRQHIVQRLNAPEEAAILVSGNKKSTGLSDVSSIKVARRDYKHLVNVHFSHVGQCDPSDCDAQKEFFHVTEHAEPQNAWYFKHLLDMDGNAFSGRFYSFLKSHSLTYKMAIFREWHAEWLTPWVHYIPLSLRGDEHLDLVNWFSGNQGPVEGKKAPEKSGNGDSEGEKKAREIASRSTEWHDKVLRNIDMEVWFFRLLLEYGRIVDDNREEIGYPGP